MTIRLKQAEQEGLNILKKQGNQKSKPNITYTKTKKKKKKTRKKHTKNNNLFVKATINTRNSKR